jgi:hypothetical protein
MLTVDQFKTALPVQMKSTVNQELVDTVNGALQDQESMEMYKENLLSFTSVLQQGKFKLTNYISAVRYVGFKVMGLSNKDAYIKTFPDKYQRFLVEGVSEKDISSYTTAYNKSKLVNLIFAQAQIPTHILNAPLFQTALNVQANLMMNAKSEMVRFSAANSLLTHLKPPEVAKVELDIVVTEDKSIQALRATTFELVRQQKAMIESGAASVRSIAASKLITSGAEEEDIIDV